MWAFFPLMPLTVHYWFQNNFPACVGIPPSNSSPLQLFLFLFFNHLTAAGPVAARNSWLQQVRSSSLAGVELEASLHWECRVLATKPPEKSLPLLSKCMYQLHDMCLNPRCEMTYLWEGKSDLRTSSCIS